MSISQRSSVIPVKGTTMNKPFLLITLLLVAAAGGRAADKKAEQVDAAAAFEQLRTMVGEWTADTAMGKARLVIELIAGGSALVEREKIGDMPEMMTVYHVDGNRLLLTHYCMAGNQPRMQAAAFDRSTKEIQFRFLDATNLASPAVGHMRNATIKSIDANQFASEWQFFEDGKLKNAEKARYTRVR
jgi:hypothetical protein